MVRAQPGGGVLGASVAALVALALAPAPARATAPEGAAPAAEEAAPPDPYTLAGQLARHAARVGRRHTPSPLIIPDQTLPLRFSHRIHLADMGCRDCHGMVADSVRAADVNLPSEASCFSCHDPDEGMADPTAYPPARCETCHPGYVPEMPEGVPFRETARAKVHPPAVVLPPPNLKFNHKIHLDKGVGCEACHGDMAKVDFATRDNALPTMGTCLGCHDGRQAPSECRTCHLTTPDGRVDTRLEGQRLAPAGWYYGDAHDDGWLKSHRRIAVNDQGYCSTCHRPKECIDCHNGVQKPLKLHPNNWILTHPIAARKQEPDCSSCHRSQTFCVSCHQQTRVAWEPRDPDGLGGLGAERLRGQGIRFHPEGWADFVEIGPSHHKFQAGRNIRTCTSCHTEATCLTCHSQKAFGAAAVSPHPAGFGSSCRGRFKRNHRACVKCHDPTDPTLDECR